MGYKVIGVDVSDDSLGFAREAKIDYVFNSRSQPDYKEQIRQITGGGVEGVSVFTGVQAAYAGAVDLLRIGGVLVCVGIPAPPEVPFSILDLTLGRYKLVPANNGIKSPEDLYECVEFTHKNNIVTPTKFFELEQINEMADNVEKNVYPGMRMAVKFS
jgi:D-arabinose 1-dehydrogenase-like Zn-dependent alcohol dehydrogenase